MISALIGVPEADRARVRGWANDALYRDPDTPAVPASAMEASAHTHRYFATHVAQRRRDPGRRGDDITTVLLEAELDDEHGERGRLSDLEITCFLSLLFNAGGGTVARLLGNAVVLLARYPEARARLVADPGRIPGAVEEILRFWPPSQYQGRT